MGSRSLRTFEEVAEFSRSFTRKRRLNRETAQELCGILISAFDSSSRGRLGIAKAIALAMQFIGVAIEAVDEEVHLV